MKLQLVIQLVIQVCRAIRNLKVNFTTKSKAFYLDKAIRHIVLWPEMIATEALYCKNHCDW